MAGRVAGMETSKKRVKPKGQSTMAKELGKKSSHLAPMKNPPPPPTAGAKPKLPRRLPALEHFTDEQPSLIAIPKQPKKEKILTPGEILQKSGETDYRKVTKVKLPYEGLTDFRNLEKFVKVKHVDLSCNFITKIPRLRANKELTSLVLYSNAISTIENVYGFTHLTTLLLHQNQIKRIGPGLKGLQKLHTLRLDCNDLSALDPKELAPLVNLKTLNLSDNFLEDLSALRILPNLEELLVSKNHLTTLLCLAPCKKLTELDISYNPIEDFTGIERLPALKVLHVSCTGLRTLGTLGELKMLEMLVMRHNFLESVSTLADQFPKLCYMDLQTNKIADWSELSNINKLEGLKEVWLRENPIHQMADNEEAYLKTVQMMLPGIDQIDETCLKKSHIPQNALSRRNQQSSAEHNFTEFQTSLAHVMNAIRECETVMVERMNSVMTTFKSIPLDRADIDSDEVDSSLTLEDSTSQPLERPPSRPQSRCISRLHDALHYASGKKG